jgi:hypothetical protein
VAQGAEGYEMLQGHFTQFGVHQFSTRPMKYITILRDPVDRIISYYYHIIRSARHPQHEEIKRFSNLEEALPFVGADLQTRVLSGTARPGSPLTPNDLAAAKRNLEEHFAVVALLERFDESLILMRHALGWQKLMITPPLKNVATNRPHEVSESALKLAADLSRYDQELYAFANTLMDRQIRQIGLPYWRDRIEMQGRRTFYRFRMGVKQALSK